MVNPDSTIAISAIADAADVRKKTNLFFSAHQRGGGLCFRYNAEVVLSLDAFFFLFFFKKKSCFAE
jgi:hypothetical protein